MSLVQAIREHYDNHPRRKVGTGLPTGSKLGTCAAQMQFLRFPDRSRPEPPQGRAVRTWEQGDRVEAWLGDLLKVIYPDLVGLRQEPFYFPVALDEAGAVAVRERILSRALWGTLREGFEPPTMRLDEDGRVKLRLLANKKMGFVLEMDARRVWVPTYVDYVVRHPDHGLTVVECKSMSNFSFRRTVLGELDYGKRCQLVGFARATGAATVLFAYRNETAHLAEVAYTRTAERVRVVLTKPNGTQEAYFVDAKTPSKPLVPEAGGAPHGIPAALLWEGAQTWTPYDEALADIIDERVRRVLLADPDGPRHREAGPDFTCPTCAGSGTQTMRKGTAVPLKEPKPCETCGQSGRVEETELGFPCSYCSVVTSACFPFARLEIDDRPHYKVSRADWEASGLGFTVPEGWR